MRLKTKVYFFDVSELNKEDKQQTAFSYMSEKEKQKILSYKSEKDQLLSLGSKLLLKGVTIRYTECLCPIINNGRNGKPYFRDFPDIHFNLSHDGAYTMCIISGSEAGCDIQKKEPLQNEIHKRFFTNEECEFIENSADKQDAFYRIWVLKESYIKALGTGLSTELNSFSVVNNNGEIAAGIIGDNLNFFELPCPENYKSACCVSDFENDTPECEILCFDDIISKLLK